MFEGLLPSEPTLHNAAIKRQLPENHMKEASSPQPASRPKAQYQFQPESCSDEISLKIDRET